MPKPSLCTPKPKTVQEEPLKVGFGYEMATDPVTSQGSSLGDLHSANKFQRREENLGAENGRNMCKTCWTPIMMIANLNGPSEPRSAAAPVCRDRGSVLETVLNSKLCVSSTTPNQ